MGRRFIRLLEGQLHHLREHANHGNRCFFYDQLVVAHLLAFFNPILAGLRKIEDVFDPELLLPLFEPLKERADIQGHDPRLDAIETVVRPGSYDYALMSMAVAGLAPLDQILAQAAKRRAARRRAAERQRARRAQKNSG